MTRTGQNRLRWILAALVSFLGAGLVLGFLVAWSGLFSVAASRGHWAVIDWFMTFGMRNSVETHARNVSVPPGLDNPNLVSLGAAHFHGRCADCHGAPGIPLSPIAQAMLPPPPDLSHAAKAWRDNELFWIVHNGLKYTGMPAWPAPQREDEVWAIVAFLKRLPDLDVAQYRELALGGVQIPLRTGRQIAVNETTSGAVSACARCHGADDRGPSSDLVPLLHGQSQAYLTEALDAYATGQRPSGIMQPVAADLPQQVRREVAEYYAGLPMPDIERVSSTAAPGSVIRGRTLVEEGDADRAIPPCLSCHDSSARESYPRLIGQNASYTANRLRTLKRQPSALSDGEAIMAPIAKLLTDQDIEAASVYFQSLRPMDKNSQRQ